jgi:ribosomal protein S11
MVFVLSKNYKIFLKFRKKHIVFSSYYQCFYLFLGEKNLFLSNNNFTFKRNFNYNLSYLYFFLVIKNLLRVFFRRYRTVILRKRFFKIVGFYRLYVLRWSNLMNSKISSRFVLPMIFGSSALFSQFKRQDWLFLLRFNLYKNTQDFNLSLYFEFLQKSLKFFPKRRLLLLNKVFICRIRSTKNNLFLNFFFINGRSLVSASAGSVGFNGKKKRTPIAAKKTAIFFARKVRSVLSNLNVKIDSSFFIIKLYGKSSSSLFKEALNGLRIEKFPCNLIIDKKTVSHGGTRRLKKPRRV